MLVILGQIGCFVPAERAVQCVFHKIFSKIGTNDDLEIQQSSLSMELTQVRVGAGRAKLPR